MSYYDIDAILTDAEKIPCEFNFEIPDLGHLDNNPALSLKAGTKLSLPLWLAEMLALANTSGASTADEDAKSFVNLSLPPALSNEVVQALKADPRAVPLRAQSTHFYGLATRLMDLFEERELDSVLRRTFVTRAADIALHARKGTGGAGKEDASNLGMSDGGEFLKGLDEWERKLFRNAHDGTKAGRAWMENVKKH
ncbi:DNA replication protein [Cytospora paraplurivora]|uniref:DNA replication complex GINS protein PSF3 n=1 Tax=Cytospora paraplurivora TaxID=2898453 RepID=A0AAN9UHZ3_9PEZI